jgi:23S rRNA (cytosine1962-C5)-methyltransferase
MTPSALPPIVLKKGRDKPVRQGHPWVFSGAIANIPDVLEDGAIVDVVDAGNNWLGRGYLNRKSQIQVRVLTRDASEFDPAADEIPFWRARIHQAVALRARLLTQWTAPADASVLAPEPSITAFRLINGESDGLPGLIVDCYGDYLALEVGTLGIERRKHDLARLLLDATAARGVIERSDTAARRQEGLAGVDGVLAGELPAGPVDILEYGLRFQVDILRGQKTGFYLDQRENRRRVAAYCPGARVLNAFGYTGAFAVHALAAGAEHVTSIDTSAEALARSARHIALNGFDVNAQAAHLEVDVFELLRDWRSQEREPFDVIILDPPKFAHNRQGIDKALRGYKDINLSAMQLLRPGGILATFSCSGLVDAALFQKVVFGAAVDAGRQVRTLEWLRQAPDHPVAVTFPEGEYLKGLICHVT